MRLLILFIIAMAILLYLIFRLVLKYIRLRQSLKRYDFEMQLQISKLSSKQKAEHELLEMEEELHTIIDRRLKELELTFTEKDDDFNSVTPETIHFTHSFKRMLKSTLTLFKIEHS